MTQKGLIISYLRTRLSDRLLDFGEDLQLWVERNLYKLSVAGSGVRVILDCQTIF